MCSVWVQSCLIKQRSVCCALQRRAGFRVDWLNRGVVGGAGCACKGSVFLLRRGSRCSSLAGKMLLFMHSTQCWAVFCFCCCALYWVQLLMAASAVSAHSYKLGISTFKCV